MEFTKDVYKVQGNLKVKICCIDHIDRTWIADINAVIIKDNWVIFEFKDGDTLLINRDDVVTVDIREC